MHCSLIAKPGTAHPVRYLDRRMVETSPGSALNSLARPLFTVFTPTYNRAHLLHRVYESLLAQTYRNFEWLIVDDGSTDDTATVIKSWQQDTSTWFPIRYFCQTNRHKKSAFNYGVREAAGSLFICADSDDRFLPEALQRFAFHWEAIPESDRAGFAGVCGLCAYEDGSIVGSRFPGESWVDSDSQEIRYRYRVAGEKWGFTRTDLLLRFPYPEHLPGHVPEGVVWSRIARLYKTRFINEVVRVYYQDSAEASSQVTRSLRPEDAASGMVCWKRVVLSEEIAWFRYEPKAFFLDAARLVRFGLHRGLTGEGFWPRSAIGCLLVLVAAPAGLVWWLYDRVSLRRNSNA